VSGPAADIQPQLWVSDGPAGVAFYERAFGAVVEYRLSGPTDTDVVAQLAVAGARFWLSSCSDSMGRFSPDSIGGTTGRLLLVVSEPDALVRRAVAAGATLTSEVSDEHGWRLGRLEDPFGHEWEIGKPVAAWPPQAG